MSLPCPYKHSWDIFYALSKNGHNKVVSLIIFPQWPETKFPLRETINSKENLVWFTIGKWLRIEFLVSICGKSIEKAVKAYFDKANPSRNLTVTRLIFHILTLERNGLRHTVGKEGQEYNFVVFIFRKSIVNQMEIS